MAAYSLMSFCSSGARAPGAGAAPATAPGTGALARPQALGVFGFILRIEAAENGAGGRVREMDRARGPRRPRGG